MAKKDKSNKGSAHLERVKAKAMFNFQRRAREAEETRAFQESLESGNPFFLDDEEANDTPDTEDETPQKGKK